MERFSYDELYHWGVPNQRWGQRRFQYEDGTWTEEGKRRRRFGRALNPVHPDNWSPAYRKNSVRNDIRSIPDDQLEKLTNRIQAENTLLDKNVQQAALIGRSTTPTYLNILNGIKDYTDVVSGISKDVWSTVDNVRKIKDPKKSDTDLKNKIKELEDKLKALQGNSNP